ncbi:MAG: phosphonate ABC transporter, permease protein PhnE [Candidatus Rokubacteria bacterium]|nr:phosphonate ABC transporter, permease protein PhnE [Candidatus Rokubacteria bacterium]
MIPARPRGHARARWLTLAAGAGLVAWSYQGTEVDLRGLLAGEAAGQMVAYVARLFPPDLSRAALASDAQGAVETFAISFVGSLLAVGLALPLSLVATRTLLYRGVLYESRRLSPAARLGRMAVCAAGRALLAFLRTIPELLWAVIFVFVVGLGPFPGALALGFHTAGVLGKLFGETLEDVDPRPLEALASTGAGRLRILLYGMLPQAAPQFLSYALYRWEVNIRAAAILGLVGAGGLGQRIHVAISLFLERELLTLILAVYAMVTLVDALSAYLRRRVV